jgi:hypothetical protein
VVDLLPKALTIGFIVHLSFCHVSQATKLFFALIGRLDMRYTIPHIYQTEDFLTEMLG